MYIRNTADIFQKWWWGMRNADIIPNWDDMRTIADITKLGDIGRRHLTRR